MNVVLDASAIVDLLLRNAAGEQVRALLERSRPLSLLTVAHADAEVFSALSRVHRAGDIDAAEVGVLLDHLGRLAIERLPIAAPMLQAAWALRDNVAARDALYVVVAQHLDATLVTTDERLRRAVPDVTVALP